MLDPQFAALAYIRHVLEETGLSPSGLAKQAGISSTTLTRPINNPHHKFAISTSTISKIASSTGINPAPFFETSNIVQQRRAITENFLTRRPIKGNFAPQEGKYKFLLPIGEINTGEWRENDLSNPALYVPLFITHSWLSHEDVFAVIVVDGKANAIADPGEYLICSDYEAGHQFFKLSGIVIVQKLSDGGRLVQLVACQAKSTDGGWNMHPTTDIAGINEPFFLPNLIDEFEGVQVIGIVHYVARPPRLLLDA